MSTINKHSIIQNGTLHNRDLHIFHINKYRSIIKNYKI